MRGPVGWLSTTSVYRRLPSHERIWRRDTAVPGGFASASRRPPARTRLRRRAARPPARGGRNACLPDWNYLGRRTPPRTSLGSVFEPNCRRFGGWAAITAASASSRISPATAHETAHDLARDRTRRPFVDWPGRPSPLTSSRGVAVTRWWRCLRGVPGSCSCFVACCHGGGPFVSTRTYSSSRLKSSARRLHTRDGLA